MLVLAATLAPELVAVDRRPAALAEKHCGQIEKTLRADWKNQFKRNKEPTWEPASLGGSSA